MERQAAWVSPEQSNEDGPVAPQTYGFPSAPYANAMASAARALGAWTGARVVLRPVRSAERALSELS